MATAQEKVAHIEAALRHRFFRYLTVPGETERLSRSLAAYALVKHCRVSDLIATGAIVDGSDDGGIDAIYFDRPTNRLVFVQSKFKRAGTSPVQDETLKTLNGVDKLLKRDFLGFNAAIQARFDDIDTALDIPGVRVDIVMTYLGDTFNLHAKGDLDRFCRGWNSADELVQWYDEGLSRLYDWLVAEQTPAEIDDKIALEHWASMTTPYKAFYGQIRAVDLVQLVERYGSALFEHNIRHYLGSAGVNKAIEQTVRSRPHELFYLNNGITAVARKITPAPGGQERRVFGLKGLSIINGAQTAGAISSAATNGPLSADARILMTIIEVGDDGDTLGRKITQARNHQNVVREVEFAALDPNQERLRRELAAVGVRYFYRSSAETKIRQDDVCTIEEAAVALACLGFTIQPAVSTARRSRQPTALAAVVAAKVDVSRLWEQKGASYRQLFTRSLTGVRLYRLIQCYRFIDRVLVATERTQQDPYRKQFFRHGRFFLMAFVALRLRELIEQPQLTLSDDEQATLSRSVDELSEIIYNASQPLQGIKGYRAIFRSLTDAQLLADDVLGRLAEQETLEHASQASDAV